MVVVKIVKPISFDLYRLIYDPKFQRPRQSYLHHLAARAPIGKTKRASVEVNTPGGAKAYEVKKVEWR